MLEYIKKIPRKYIVIGVCALLVASLAVGLLIGLGGRGLSDSVKPKSVTFYDFFDTVSTVYDYSGGSEAAFSDIVKHVEEKLDLYHRSFDIYHEYEGMNNLCTVNKIAGVQPVEVSQEIIDLLLFAKETYTLTEGNTNVAMGSVLSIWHQYRSEGKQIPPIHLLRDAKRHTDIDDLIIDEAAMTVYLADPKMSLDVGAVAKGYAVEKIADSLAGYGVNSCVLDVGGNLRAIGTKPDGSGWKTGVQNPRANADNKYSYFLTVKNASVVTSGDYQRYYVVDGKAYHHIINKDTLMPSEYFSSVTVMFEDSGVADALSTALFNMDYDSGVELLSKFEGAFAVWVMPDGEVKTCGIDK
jgi:thiamine biosynthesis lipoprotein